MFHRVISTFPLLQGRFGLLFGPAYLVNLNLVTLPIVSAKYFSSFHPSLCSIHFQRNKIIRNESLGRNIHSTGMGCCSSKGGGDDGSSGSGPMTSQNQHQPTEWTKLTRKEWLERLSPEAYAVAREHGTEPPFSGIYVNHKAEGVYGCACCETELFSSKTKFDSKCGWPSYWAPIDESRIIRRKDVSHRMVRTEVICAKCHAHLGHVFDDGPEPTGERFCINSVVLKFTPKKLN